MLIMLNFEKRPSQQIFVGYCFQTHSGSKDQILFLIFPRLTCPCFGNPSPKMHHVNNVEFWEKTQSASVRRLLFPNIFWVQRTDLVSYFLSFTFPCFGNPSPKMHHVNSVEFWEQTRSANFSRLLFPNTFWVQRADLVSHFSKLYTFMLWKPISENARC